MVYVGSSGLEHNKSDRKDGIYCLNAKTGQIIWHYKTPKDACGVAYHDGMLISTGDDGYLRGINSESGKQVWELNRRGPLYSQPLIISDKAFVGDASGNVLAIEAATGKLLWQTKLTSSNVRGGLSSDGKKIFAAFVDGTVAALNMDGKKIWETQCDRKSFYDNSREAAEIYATPTVTGDKLIIPYARDTYYDNPAVQALDKNTGKVLWEATDNSTDKISHGNIRSSVAVWKDFLLYGNPYSNLLIALNTNDGSYAWSVPMGVETWPHWPSPVITKKMLYMGRNDGGFYAVNLMEKALAWELYLGKSADAGDMKNVEGKSRGDWKPAYGESIYATASIAKSGTIFIGSGDGWLYAIGK
jgi:outer membrane protein assembly factor BamB